MLIDGGCGYEVIHCNDNDNDNDNDLYFTTSIMRLKRAFHGPTNRADERHNTADLLDFEKIFSLCQRFVEPAD